MKAIVLAGDRSCGLSNIPMPMVNENEVLIKPVCTPVHMLDMLKIKGILGNFNGIPGFEGAGYVVKTGSGSKSRRLADKRVCFIKPHSNFGTWSEFVICEAINCYIIREELGFIKASTLMLLPLTLVKISKIIKKHKFLSIINTLAGSSLGKMIQRWCNYKKIHCINIVRSELREKELIQLGATYVVNSNSNNFLHKLYGFIEDLKPKCCFDGVGGNTAKLILKYLEVGSVMYVYNTFEGGVELPEIEFIMQKKKVKGLWMLNWFDKLAERKKQKYFKKIQKKQHVYRVDNIEIIPIYDFLPRLEVYIAEYFEGQQPKDKVILDFSDLSENPNVISYLSQANPPIFPKPTIEDFSDSEESEGLLKISELISSYTVPSVQSLLEKFSNEEPDGKTEKFSIILEDKSVYVSAATEGSPRSKGKKQIPDGYGTVYYPNGDVYKGEFEFNERKGKGTIFYSTGDWFEGSWKENIPAGTGIYHFANGNIIQGNFVQNEVIGVGVELTISGDTFEGNFLAKKRHGKGVLTCENWQFDGKFLAGDMCGHGIVRYKDGKEFIGEFEKNGIGVGVMKYPDFTCFEGKIQDFLEEGEGELVSIDGIRKKALWEKGKLKYFCKDSNTIEVQSEVKIEEYEGTPVEVINSEDVINVLVIK